MTTQTTTELKPCRMGSRTDSPCPFPATALIRGGWRDGFELCAYHAALEPLHDELEDLSGSIEELDDAIRRAKKNRNDLAVRAFKQQRKDLRERLALADKVLADLRAADQALFRKQRAATTDA